MPANDSVSLTRQTIFVLIPILDLFAFYKIKYLRKYLLIVYLGIAIVAGTAYSVVVYPDEWAFDENYNGTNIDYWTAEKWLLQIPLMAAVYGSAIYLVRRWSKKWNEQFSNSK